MVQPPMLELSTGGIYEVLVVLGHASIIGSEDKLYKSSFPGRGCCETNTRVWKSRGVILKLSGQDGSAGFWTVSCPHPFTMPNRSVCFPQPLPKNRGLQRAFISVFNSVGVSLRWKGWPQYTQAWGRVLVYVTKLLAALAVPVTHPGSSFLTQSRICLFFGGWEHAQGRNQSGAGERSR